MRRQDKNKMLYMCVVCVCDYRDILMMYLGETTPRPRGDRTKKRIIHHITNCLWVKLLHVIDEETRTFSGGMNRRLSVAIIYIY